MPLVSLRNYVAVGPRGTLAAPVAGGRMLYDWTQTTEHIAHAEQRVLSAMAVAMSAYNIAPARVFIGGFDSGGTMALRIALSHPDLFAGVLSLCGAFPTGNAPLSRLAEIRRLPVLLATGRDSVGYPPDQVCQNLRLFYAAGMSISLRQYPCGHELTTQMLSDVDRWGHGTNHIAGSRRRKFVERERPRIVTDVCAPPALKPTDCVRGSHPAAQYSCGRFVLRNAAAFAGRAGDPRTQSVGFWGRCSSGRAAASRFARSADSIATNVD